jgi:hypothetical protein
MLILLLPAVGIVVTFWLVIRRMFGAVWGRTEEHPAARVAFVLAVGAAAAFLSFVWWPNGDYRPIQPGEKGTIQGAVQEFAAIPSGRPALTRQRQAILGGAPLLSHQTNSTTTSTPTSTAPTETTTTTTDTTQTTTNPSSTVSTPTTTVEQTVSTTTTTTSTTTP